MFYKYLLFIGFIVIFESISSQPAFPDDGSVFCDTIVPRVDVIIHPDTLDYIYNNVESNQEFRADFIFSSETFVDTIFDIGFRLRGNTSRFSNKKSFKISFNTFVPGRKWHGMEKYNLNSEHNDPSIIRAKLCWDLLRQFEIPAPRSCHARVYINNNYYGLYISNEHINEEFVKSRFGNKNGNLYKCLFPADLNYLGTNPDDYKITYSERRIYDLKTNTDEDDYSDLAHFIDILNNTPEENFVCELSKCFNVNDYLKVIAVDIFTGNWDGYIYNKNNFYLYHNLTSGKFEYISYDLGNTFGIDFIGEDWGTRNIYDWHQHDNELRPLYSRIIQNQELKDRFSYYLNELMNQIAVPGNYEQRINELQDMISPFVQSDLYYPLDYGWDYSDFINSYTEILGGHVSYGLIPFINTRMNSAAIQLDVNNITPVVKYISHTHPHVGETIWIRSYVEDDNTNTEVKLLYSQNGGELQNKIMYDDGEHEDNIAGDLIYGTMISDFEQNMNIAYQISATDNYGYSTIMPCEPANIAILQSLQEDLFINEFMANNDSTIADEYGEYDDWIEIYNGDVNEVWLGDKYLTDDLQVPNKWPIPDITLQPGDFILFWADNQPEQGGYHTNFKLNKEGESIGIFDAESTDFFPLDSILYGPQLPDTSYGRLPDGSGLWILFGNPTPGYSNVLSAVGDQYFSDKKLQIFPNPVNGGIIHLNRRVSFVVYNIFGHQVLQAREADEVLVSELPNGIYFLITLEGEKLKFIKN